MVWLTLVTYRFGLLLCNLHVSRAVIEMGILHICQNTRNVEFITKNTLGQLLIPKVLE